MGIAFCIYICYNINIRKLFVNQSEGVFRILTNNLRKKNIIVAVLLIIVGLLRILLEQKLRLPYGCVITGFFILVYVHWIRNSIRRFPQIMVRKRILIIGALVIFFELLRLIKLNFCVPSGVFERYIWYFYYIPIILLPLLNLDAMIYAGLPDSIKPPVYWNLLYVVAVSLIIGVITNDLHLLAFRFSPYEADWEKNYHHGPLFQIVTAWVVVMIVFIFIHTVKMCISRRLYKNLWMPVLVVVIGLVYRLSYRFFDESDKFFLQQMYELPELYGMVWIALWESIVSAKLLPANDGYNNLLEASSIRGGLTDAGLNLRQSFSDGPVPDKDQLSYAKSGELVLSDGGTLLKACPVRGGVFYWLEDIAALNKLKIELEKTADYLMEENIMLQQEAEIDEASRSTRHQTYLYDTVASKIGPQMKKIDDMLASPPDDEKEFRDMLKKVSVLYVFCKRLSYLVILGDSKRTISAEDFLVCMEESAFYLRCAGFDCEISISPIMSLPGETTLALYELFEFAAENFDVPSKIKVSLNPSVDENENGSYSEFILCSDIGIGSAETLLEFAKKLGNARIRSTADGCELSLRLEGEGV